MTIKLLVVEDTIENLDVARNFFSRKRLVDHDSSYVRKVSEGLDLIGSHDALVTDLFFSEPDEPIHPDYLHEIMHLNRTLKRIQNSMPTEVAAADIGVYYRREIDHGNNGRLLGRGLNDGSEFAYGLLMMLKASALKKPSVLVTTMHRHEIGGSSAVDPLLRVDGAVVLAPLVYRNIITPEESDRNTGLHYVGDLIDKTTKKPWEQSFKKIREQYKR